MKSRTRNRKKLRLCQTTSLLLILSFLIAVIPTLPLFAETADTDEITIVREETDRRTANEKHYLCSDGSIMAVAFAGDVHYRDENGAYQAIDNTLQYNAAKGQYRSAGNPNFSASFASSANRPAVLLNNGKGNHLSFITSVSLQPSSAAAAKALQLESAALSVRNESKINVKGKLKNSAEALRVPELHSEIDYQNAFGSGVSAQYALDSTSLKENVVFDYPTSYTAIVTRYTMDGLTVEVTESGALVLYDGAGEAVYAVSAPYMYDAAGAECPSVAVNAVQTDEGWTVTYVPDAAWRNSAERVYPVVFDPSTTTVSSGSFVDSYNVAVNGQFTQNRNNEYLYAGEEFKTDSVTFSYDSFLKPSFPNVPAGNTATQAEIVLTKYIVKGSGTLRLHPITSGSFPLNSHEYGSSVAMTQYNAGTTQQTYSFVIPAADLPEDGVENGFVVKEINGTGNSHYLQVYSSRATTVANRPKTVVTYVATGISGKVTTLQNPESAHYLTASSSTAVSATAAATPKSLWKFLSVDAGCFRIQSQYHSGKCLGMNSDGNLALCATPTTTTDRNLLWIVTVYNGIYTIHNAANTNKKLYISPDGNDGYSAGVGEASVSYTEWQMQDLIFQYATTLYSTATSRYLTASSESTVTMTENSTEKSLWKYVLTSNGNYRIQSQYYSEKCLAADANGTLSLEIANTNNQNQLWYVTAENGIFNFTNVQYETNLYSLIDDEDTVQFGIDANDSVALENEQWMLTDLVIGIEEYAVTMYHPQAGRYLTTESDFTLSMKEFSEISSLWRFVLTNDGSCQIVSQYYPDKCLAADESGNLTLVTPSTNFTDSNQNQLWYVSVADGIYSIVNQKHKTDLYAATDAEGNVTCQAGAPTDSKTKQWNLLETVQGIQDTGKMLYNAQTDRYLTAISETTVAMTATATIELLWTYVLTDNGSYQIIPLNYPQKCLASDASGNLSLVALDADNLNQRWYICVENEKHTITNVQYDVDLYSQIASDETVTCGVDMSDSRTVEEKQWARLDYICFIKSKSTNLYLKNASGKNYNGQTMSVGSDARGTSNQTDEDRIGDKCGFRIVYYVQYGAYMIMPISSSNGYQRGVGKTSSSSNAVLVNNTNDPDDSDDVVDVNQLLLNFELQSDGSYVIKLRSNPTIALTDNGNTQTVTFTSVSNGATNSQKWTFSTYQYVLPNGTKASYTQVENYYKSLGFGNPFGVNPERSLLVTSDFGVRWLSDNSPNDVHEGLDLRTKLPNNESDYQRKLYSPYDGDVVVVSTSGINSSTGSGAYIMIDTGIPAYNDAAYTICIVYMHLDAIYVRSGQEIRTDTLLGETGNSGSGGPHLHYGVFLRKSGASYSANSNPLNPSWFLTPEEYSINP